jgi:hypothetical protein
VLLRLRRARGEAPDANTGSVLAGAEDNVRAAAT